MPACRSIVLAISLTLAPTYALAITPDNPGPGDVLLTIDAGENVRPISPYIYGMNFFAGSSLTNPVTLDRLGGNRWTGYNWETNYSNAGSDFQHYSDNFLVGFASNTPPGEAVRGSLEAAAANNRALIVTVPIAGYVSADDDGPVAAGQTAPSSRWIPITPKKATVHPGVPFSLTPDEGDEHVFTDEFVHWVETNKAPGQQVFYTLDNEPGLWDDTHPRIYPSTPSFADVLSKSIDNAVAIKDAYPNAKVFSPPGWGWGDFASLSGAPDFTTSPPHPGAGDLDWHEWFLQQVALEEAEVGHTLIDVLDMHWYTEMVAGGSRITENNNSAAAVAARVQAPRSLWDPTYTESSWITDCCSGGPIQLLNRVQADIDSFKPGTEIAITEYNYGGTNHISGGIAQADALGIFAQEDVFAATFWSLHGDANSQFASGAFKMYLDYDGQGGAFGDMIVDAATDDIAASSIYASLDSENPNRMIVVAINRTPDPLDAAIALTSDRQFTSAEVYQLQAGNPNPTQASDIAIDLVNAFHYMMPGHSVSTLVLTSPGFTADFDGDGDVDRNDLTHPTLGWEVRYGVDLDGEDFLTWQRQYGLPSLKAVSSPTTVIPEPSAALLIFLSLAPACRRFKPRSRNLR